MMYKDLLKSVKQMDEILKRQNKMKFEDLEEHIQEELTETFTHAQIRGLTVNTEPFITPRPKKAE